MSSFPCLIRFVSGSDQVRYRLGERLVDRYLEFVAGRCRPNTLRAAALIDADTAAVDEMLAAQEAAAR